MVDTVVVALPPVDDKVSRISSEKVPHLTILYLGEANLSADAVLYIEHACAELNPFYASVEHRGTLGTDEADVLFFEDNGWDLKQVKEFRHYLLLNDEIKRAYDSAQQFPEWTPHLTLGYPESPANEDDSDYPGIHSVRFDRISVWLDEYNGPTFRLKYDEYAMEVSMSSTQQIGADAAAGVLAHFGVKGMKWGVSRAKGSQKKADAAQSKADAMTNRAERRSNRLGSAAEARKGAKLQKEADRLQRRANTAAAKSDKAYDKQFEGVKGFVKVNNAIAEKINPRLDTLNNSAKYKDKDLTDPKNSALHKQYMNDYRSDLQKSLNEVMADLGTNASGTKRFDLEVVGEGMDTTWQGVLKDIEHAEVKKNILDGFVVVPNFDANGKITTQVLRPLDEALNHYGEGLETALAHYGVKGMKWGVTTKDNATKVTLQREKTALRDAKDVTVTQRKAGTYVKARGGQRQKAADDAVRAQAGRQKAKKSTTDALSNAELKQTIERMRLEQEFAKLDKRVSRRGKGFVAKLLQTPEAKDTAADLLKRAAKASA